MSAKVIYSAVDGILVDQGGCLMRDRSGRIGMACVLALADLLDAGVALVLVSARARHRASEMACLLGADGFIGEHGAIRGWAGGTAWERLTGATPTRYCGGPLLRQLERDGLVAGLLARFSPSLHVVALADSEQESVLLLRGRVDVGVVAEWLSQQGFGWLRLIDERPLARAGKRPDSEHLYRLQPQGVSTAAAVAADLSRRGVSPAAATALCDPQLGLDLACVVGQIYEIDPSHPEATATVGPALVDHAALRQAGSWAQAVRNALR